ncbi:UNVERIFIED_CONTAM: hypothetical protein Slati_0435500 [Sesamum latifolium]|uniref:Reverse transcriptase domain-containing protein n=1 Tax=Sesamum latifolium TaxID=2727402 RepID=A0AAW2XVD8_9LAMI
MFSSTRPDGGVIDEIVACLEPKVSEAMNLDMLRLFTKEEVKRALDEMQPLKSSGLGAPLNHTHIVLLLKCAHLELISDFRPISLCNVRMRLIITWPTSIKILNLFLISAPSLCAMWNAIVNWIKPILAYEVNHYLAHKYKGNSGYVSLKLDLTKAYDRVEWNFLERVFVRLGFHPRFVALIMLCVTSVSFSFMFNGKPFNFLQLRRGLRQGDPLSSYLFMFCAEAFSSSVHRAEEEGLIRGIRVIHIGLGCLTCYLPMIFYYSVMLTGRHCSIFGKCWLGTLSELPKICNCL